MNYWEEVFQGNPGYYMDIQNPSRTVILDYISSRDSVLDLGCGGGALRPLMSEYAMNNGQNVTYEIGRYLGIDYSPTAITLATDRFSGLSNTEFRVGDSRIIIPEIPDNSHDVVVMRHFLENQQDWKKVVQEAFRICNKKVIIVMRRPFVDTPSRLLEENNKDTWVWDINLGEFNMMARHLSVNVSYGKVNDEEIIIIGKHLDSAVFDLDDFYDENNNLPLLLDLKNRFPALKVTLFCIPSKCSVDFIQDCKNKYGDWMEFAVHGWYHDTEHGTARECDFWTEDEAHKYLSLAEQKDCFVKGFRAPGWNINIETYRVLAERGYWIADHKDHDRWEQEIKIPRYKTGHLAEVHGHIQQCNMNGLEDLASWKCNFGPQTKFRFVSEALDTKEYLPNAY